MADATGKETVEQGQTSLNEGFRARVPATRQERACGGRLRREVNPGVERIDIAVAVHVDEAGRTVHQLHRPHLLDGRRAIRGWDRQGRPSKPAHRSRRSCPGLLWFAPSRVSSEVRLRGSFWMTSTTCTGIQASGGWSQHTAASSSLTMEPRCNEAFPSVPHGLSSGGVRVNARWKRTSSLCVCLKATHEGIPVVVHVTSARDFATLEKPKAFQRDAPQASATVR